MQKGLIGLVDDPKPCCVDIVDMSVILFILTGLVEDLRQPVDDLEIDLFVLTAIDSHFSRLHNL